MSLAFVFFFNDTATTEIYTLSLHDALPICGIARSHAATVLEQQGRLFETGSVVQEVSVGYRSEEHTSELQSHSDLVCRLLLEKKKKETTNATRPASTPSRHSRANSSVRNGR